MLWTRTIVLCHLAVLIAQVLTSHSGYLIEECSINNTSYIQALTDKIKSSGNETVLFLPCKNQSSFTSKICLLPGSTSSLVYAVVGPFRSKEQLSTIFKEIGLHSFSSKTYFDIRQTLSKSSYVTKTILNDILQEWNWNFVYIYVDGRYDNFIPRCPMTQSNGEMHCHFASVSSSKYTNASEFLRMTRSEAILHYSHRFIVACNEVRTAEILKQANLLGMFDNEYHWLLFSAASEPIMQALGNLQADSNVRLARGTIEKELFVKPDIKDLYSSHLNMSSLTSLRRFCDWSNSALKSNNLSEISLEDLSSENFKIEIVDVVSPFSRKKSPNLQITGTWNSITGYRREKSYRDLRNFEGIHLRVATIDTPPYVIVDKTSGNFSGYLPELLHIVSEYLNFSYTIIQVPDQEYGRLVDGKRWTGIIGEVNREEADLGIANLTPTQERSEAVRFLTTSVAIGGYRLMYKRPEAFDNQKKEKPFVNPFSASCWVCIGIILFVMSLLLCWTYQIYGKVKWRGRYPVNTSQQSTVTSSSNSAEDSFSFRNLVFVSLQAAALQGFSDVPDGAASRIIFISMWLFCLLAMAAFSATLTSFFTYTDENLPFTSLAGFLRQNEYKIAYKKGTSYLALMSKAKNGEFPKVMERIALDPRSQVDDLMAGFELASTEKYVFAHDQQTLRWMAAKSCGMVVVGPTYFRAGVTFAVPHNSPFHRDLSLALAYLWEDGVMSRLQKTWWPKPLDCSSSNDQFRPIATSNMVVPILLLAIGLVLGALAIIAERYTGLLPSSKSLSKKSIASQNQRKIYNEKPRAGSRYAANVLSKRKLTSRSSKFRVRSSKCPTYVIQRL